MFPFIGAQRKSGLITADIMEPGDIRALAKAPGGEGDCEGTCGLNWEDSLGPEVLARLGGGGLSMGHV